MKTIIDTSAYSAMYRGDVRLKKYLKADLYIPVIVVGELRAGFANGSKQQQNEMYLCRFLDAPNVTFLKIGDKTTKIYGKIFAQLRKTGTPIGTNDMWVAALCIEHKLPLLTLDSDFNDVKNLKCLAV